MKLLVVTQDGNDDYKNDSSFQGDETIKNIMSRPQSPNFNTSKQEIKSLDGSEHPQRHKPDLVKLLNKPDAVLKETEQKLVEVT